MIDPIDNKLSHNWAVRASGDSGAIAMGYATFDLLNVDTWREHKLYVTSFGPIVSFSLKSSKWGSGAHYQKFYTERKVNFKDFDNANTATVTMGGIGMAWGYSYIKTRIWDPVAFGPLLAEFTIKGSSVMFGFKVRTGVGNTKIDYGNGSPSDAAASEVPQVLNLDYIPTEKIIIGRMTDYATEDSKIVLPADTLFRFNSSSLTVLAEDNMHRAAMILNERTKKSLIYVEGHTDSLGDAEYNMQLSKRRAESVAAWLKRNGIVGADTISAVGFGENHPVQPNEVDGKDNPKGRSANRRVEITF